MGLFEQLKKLLTGVGSAGVEWDGQIIEIALRPLDADQWGPMMRDAGRRNVWVELAYGKQRDGATKLLARAGRLVVGELSASKLARNQRLAEALGKGVNIGVVRLTNNLDRDDPPEAVLFLGRDYKYRPQSR